MKIDKKRVVFVVSALVICTFILYLGARAMKHEVLTRQEQSFNYAQSRVNHITSKVQNILQQKAAHIEAISSFIEPNYDNFSHLLENEIDIKNIFALQNSTLIFPADLDASTAILDMQKQLWQQTIQTILYDPTVLSSHYLNSEQAKPQQGWYITYDNNGPVLIYWTIHRQVLMGYQLSYAKLLLDLVQQFDEQLLDDEFIIKDNGLVIYDHLLQSDNPQEQQSIAYLLDYPLKNWQIDYFYHHQSNTIFYVLASGIILLFIGFICAIFIYGYREYTRTLRLAKQQVGFVGQVSHEFKTPLTNITLYSELLKERLSEEPSPIPEYLDVITQESHRLTRLIQNVLNFTKTAKLNITQINLNEVLAQHCQVFQVGYHKKGMQLNFTPYSGNAIIDSDKDSIVQIINNFLSNAEKYASQGKQVDLTIIKEKEQFHIKVRDYGAGIAKSALDDIFKPFYRVNTRLTEGVSGTGIGLTIAKQLAEKLQGDVTVKNSQPGVTFTLILPQSMVNVATEHKDN